MKEKTLKNLAVIAIIGTSMYVAVPAQAGGCPEDGDHAVVQKTSTSNISVHNDLRDKFQVFNINAPVFLKAEQITEGKEKEGAKLLYMKYMRVESVAELSVLVNTLAKDGGIGASAANKLIITSWLTDAKVARIVQELLKDKNDLTASKKEGLMYKAREFEVAFPEHVIEGMEDLGSDEPIAFQTYGMKKKDKTPVWVKTVGVIGLGVNIADKFVSLFDKDRWSSGWDLDISDVYTF